MEFLRKEADNSFFLVVELRFVCLSILWVPRSSFIFLPYDNIDRQPYIFAGAESYIPTNVFN